MLVATFGASTAWAGKTITFDGSSLVLEGHGPVSAAQVLVYESQGHLIWASEQSTEMVRTMATAAAPVPATPPPVGGESEWKDTKRWLGTPRQLTIAAVLLVVMIGAWVVVSQMVRDEERPAVIVPATLDDATNAFEEETAEARESAVREGIHSIQIGAQSWAVDHGDAYPDASLVNEVDMFDYIDIWPTNPYTDLPMTQGTEPGDFSYALTAGGGFKLTGYGADGQALITVP